MSKTKQNDSTIKQSSSPRSPEEAELHSILQKFEQFTENFSSNNQLGNGINESVYILSDHPEIVRIKKTLAGMKGSNPELAAHCLDFFKSLFKYMLKAQSMGDDGTPQTYFSRDLTTMFERFNGFLNFLSADNSKSD
jgi:hypothetical protein